MCLRMVNNITEKKTTTTELVDNRTCCLITTTEKKGEKKKKKKKLLKQKRARKEGKKMEKEWRREERGRRRRGDRGERRALPPSSPGEVRSVSHLGGVRALATPAPGTQSVLRPEDQDPGQGRFQDRGKQLDGAAELNASSSGRDAGRSSRAAVGHRGTE